MDAADVAVPTAVGGTLSARFFWPRELRVARNAKGLPALLAAAANGAATLIVHQYSVMGGSQELMRGIARELAFRQGCVAVTFDLRGVGASSGRCTLTGHGEADDVAEMGAWLQAAGFSRILLLCTSAGAPIGGSALDRVPAFTGCVARSRRVPQSERAAHPARSRSPPQIRRFGLRLRLVGQHPVFGPLPSGAGLGQAEAVHPGAAQGRQRARRLSGAFGA
jgi:pimeloyl-ACP methyl ester carboxylesterase